MNQKKKNDTLKRSMEEAMKKAKEAEYQSLADGLKPKTPYLRNMLWAFLTGGFICVIGQAILEILLAAGMIKQEAITVTLVIIIFFGSLLTGLGVYDKIGKHAGAGSIVPISGFANSVVSPAMEWRQEGFIGGLAAKMFTLAGPVIVYGICGSIVLGLIKYLWLHITGGL